MIEFMATVQGGVGPDVWEKELIINASDFMDAATYACHKAEEWGGQVTMLEQCD